MRRLKITFEESRLLFSAMDAGDPEKGLSMSDIRYRAPLMDKLEGLTNANADDRTMELILEETEFYTIMGCLELSKGWANYTVGKQALRLLEKIIKLPFEEGA